MREAPAVGLRQGLGLRQVWEMHVQPYFSIRQRSVKGLTGFVVPWGDSSPCQNYENCQPTFHLNYQKPYMGCFWKLGVACGGSYTHD